MNQSHKIFLNYMVPEDLLILDIIQFFLQLIGVFPLTTIGSGNNFNQDVSMYFANKVDNGFVSDGLDSDDPVSGSKLD